MIRDRAHLLALLATLAGARAANAQVPTYTPPPTTLDPGATNTPAPTPQPTGPQRPNVVVVDGNGNVVGGDGGGKTGPQHFFVTKPGTPSDSGDQDPADVYSGPVPELHVVRSGDTLWDICWYYFNDPWQWPKIWSYNPQITNPHWIYPGDLVRLLPRGVFVAPNEKLQDPEKTPTKQPQPTDNIPPPAKKLEVSVKQIAFVEKSDLDRSITIDGSVDEKELLGTGDQVYLTYPADKPPQVGKRYSIYKPDNMVKSGKTEVGAYVRLMGTIEIASVKQDKRARGTIVDANQEITRGLKVGPLVTTFHTVPPATPKVDAQGSVVAILKHEQLIGQGEVVFLDLGAKSGVEVGNRMFIVRRGDAYPAHMDRQTGQDDRRFPARALGELVIVEVGDKISIGLITLAVQEMAIGDIVMMQKAQ